MLVGHDDNYVVARLIQNLTKIMIFFLNFNKYFFTSKKYKLIENLTKIMKNKPSLEGKDRRGLLLSFHLACAPHQ